MGSSRIRLRAGALTALWLLGALGACERERARAPAPMAASAPLISRADLFGDPIRQGGQLSPRGDRVAFLAPRDGVINLWVLSVDALGEAQPVTDDDGRGFLSFAWAKDNATLLYLQDERGDGAARLFAVDAGGGAPRALTPAGTHAEIIGLSASDPGGVIVSLNQRDADWPDAVRVDIASGERAMVERNAPGAAARGFSRFVLDGENQVRLGVRKLPDGGAEISRRGADGAWSTLLSVPFEDVAMSQPIAIEAGGASFLMFDSTARDRAALVRVDMETGAKTVLGESARADVVDVWLHPGINAPEAFGAEYLRREWRALDPEAQADLDFLDRQLTGEFRVVSRSDDDARWVVEEEGPVSPPRSYLYDRGERSGRRLTLLFRQRPALEQAVLAPMTPVEIEARDGLTLVSYLTLPAGSDANGDGRPEAPLPLALAPHAGPWARDSYGFNALHQWLANRGYAVLSVNFRGSSGFGKAFLNAGNGEWGGRMQEDLLDAVQWAVEGGVAEPDRVAIIGAGFGGYAALAGLAFTPQQFRCAVSFAGAGNLAAMLDQAPASARDELYLRVGDARAGEGRRLLRERSPSARAGQIRNPLLLALGGRDAHYLRADADDIAQAVRARGGRLTYVVFPDEGRTLTRPANRLSYLAIAEHFLGDCLGGRVEPVGAAFEGANMDVYDGAVNVPGLSAFARRAAAPQRRPAEPAPDRADGAIEVQPVLDLAAPNLEPEAAPAPN